MKRKISNIKCVFCNGDTSKIYIDKERYKCYTCKKSFTNGKVKTIKIKNVQEIITLSKEGKSCSEISRLYDCDPETIRYHLKKHDIDTSLKNNNVKCVYCNGKTHKAGDEYGKQRYKCFICKKSFDENSVKNIGEKIRRHDLIKKLYLEDKLSTVKIGEILGVSSTIPQRILKKYGLTRDINTAIELLTANNHGVSVNEYLETLPAFKKYRTNVNRITRQQPIHLLPNYEKRGNFSVKDAYNLDHKYSVLEGFKNHISPEIIGNVANLEFIPLTENCSKHSKCSITIEELMNKINS